jgi:hypothetical protein
MRVKCIKSFDVRGRIYQEIIPLVGVTYTVRALMHYPQAGYGYLLEEIRNEPHNYAEAFAETIFDTKHFRPVTDISIFTRLTKIRKLEDA